MYGNESADVCTYVYVCDVLSVRGIVYVRGRDSVLTCTDVYVCGVCGSVYCVYIIVVSVTWGCVYVAEMMYVSVSVACMCRRWSANVCTSLWECANVCCLTMCLRC